MNKRGKLLYKGKAKALYATDEPKTVIMEFTDNATAFNGVKHAVLPGKGALNNAINSFIMGKLNEAGIAVHHQQKLSANESLVSHLNMIPVECVVRNMAAGSLCKRLGIQEGKLLEPPVFEFFYKNDALGDPLINADHIRMMGLATPEELAELKSLSFNVNAVLKPLFEQAGIRLVDYKLEFGKIGEKLVLGDEFTPDGCRLWDLETNEILDKDRFRKDLGNVVEAYGQIAERLGVELPDLCDHS